MFPVVVGLGFGDEGKGSIVDWLVREREASLVVRFSGGAQTAHHVVEEGREHCFRQFGSGTFAGARTFLSRHVLVNPLSLLNEGGELGAKGIYKPFALLTIDERAPLVTPYHVAVGRLRELARGAAAHGSCGNGVGEAARDALEHPAEALRAGDLRADNLNEKLDAARNRLWVEAEALSFPATDEALVELRRLETRPRLALLDAFRLLGELADLAGDDWLPACLQNEQAVFEGSQGVLLDEDWGFHPHTTWSRTTHANAVELADEAGVEVERWGVLRAFGTRHGAGPFPTEDRTRGTKTLLAGDHNQPGRWQGDFRVGTFDAILTAYALDVAPCDRLALTCLDRGNLVAVCTGYWNRRSLVALDPTDFAARAAQTAWLARQRPWVTRRVLAGGFGDWVEERFGIPVAVESWGPRADAKRAKVAA